VRKLEDRLESRSEGLRLVDLAREFEVSTRQMRRDIQALDARGHSIEWFKRGEFSCAKLVERRTKDVRLTRSERFSLLADLQMVAALEGTFIYEDHKSLHEKLLVGLTKEQRTEVESFRRRFAFIPESGIRSYRGKEDVIDALYTGALNKRYVRYHYRSASAEEEGRPEKGILAPFGIALHRQALFIVGPRVDEETAAGKKPITARSGPFEIGRFVSAEFISRSSFEVPPDFNVADVFEGALGIYIGKDVPEPQRIVIEFTKHVAPRVVERTFHPSQVIDRLSDGRVRLSFVLRILRIESFVLQWAEDAKVIEPKELADSMVAKLRSTLARYASDGTLRAGSV
jgi:predicted DNA-binding transcriptional regulator YafY